MSLNVTIYIFEQSHYECCCLSSSGDESISKAELRLTDIADTLQGDWLVLARLLHVSDEEITRIQTEYSYVSEQALMMLHLWVQDNSGHATGTGTGEGNGGEGRGG